MNKNIRQITKQEESIMDQIKQKTITMGREYDKNDGREIDKSSNGNKKRSKKEKRKINGKMDNLNTGNQKRRGRGFGGKESYSVTRTEELVQNRRN